MAIDSEQYLLAKNWILSMIDREDDENGEELWLWMAKNNELAKADSRNLFNTFFMFFRDDPNVVVATGSIVADDQEMGKRFNLDDSISQVETYGENTTVSHRPGLQRNTV